MLSVSLRVRSGGPARLRLWTRTDADVGFVRLERILMLVSSAETSDPSGAWLVSGVRRGRPRLPGVHVDSCFVHIEKVSFNVHTLRWVMTKVEGL